MTHAVCVVVRPDACDAEAARAVDRLMDADTAIADRV
jgi:hypothetical protein